MEYYCCFTWKPSKFLEMQNTRILSYFAFYASFAFIWINKQNRMNHRLAKFVLSQRRTLKIWLLRVFFSRNNSKTRIRSSEKMLMECVRFAFIFVSLFGSFHLKNVHEKGHHLFEQYVRDPGKLKGHSIYEMKSLVKVLCKQFAVSTRIVRLGNVMERHFYWATVIYFSVFGHVFGGFLVGFIVLFVSAFGSRRIWIQM